MQETEHRRRLGHAGRRRQVVNGRYAVPDASRGTLGDRPVIKGGIRGKGPACPRCSRHACCRWGSDRRGNPRWCCRGCRRTLGSSTDTVLAGLRPPSKIARVVDDMLGTEPGSCRKLAAELGIDKTTVWEWRLKIARRMQGEGPDGSGRRLRITPHPPRQSRKGSREWVRHARDPARFAAPDRPRWIDLDRLRLRLPLPIATYQLHALIVVYDSGNHPEIRPLRRGMLHSSACATMLLAGERCSHAARLGDDVARRSVPSLLPCDGERTGNAHDAQALHGAAALLQDRGNGIEWQRSDPRRLRTSPPLHRGSTSLSTRQIDAVGDLENCFARFIRPFRGPGARYLKRYTVGPSRGSSAIRQADWRRRGHASRARCQMVDQHRTRTCFTRLRALPSGAGWHSRGCRLWRRAPLPSPERAAGGCWPRRRPGSSRVAPGPRPPR